MTTSKIARVLAVALALAPLAFGTVACSNASSEAADEAPAQRAEALRIVKGTLGVSDATAAAATDPSAIRYVAVVEHMTTELLRRDAAFVDGLPAAFASGDADRVTTAMNELRARLDAVGESAELRARVATDPRFAGVAIRNQGGGGGGGNNANGGTTASSANGASGDATDTSGDSKPAGRSPDEIGKAADGTYGDDRKGAMGALKDTGTLAGVAGEGGIGVAKRAMELNAVDNGSLQPDPESRLGAYAATKGHEPGTVGHSVHNAIGTIYGGLGTYGEEKIGRVFDSDEARALYDQPVDSDAGKQMATIEHSYWQNVAKEDPYSAGGHLGSAFSPAARDFLQRNVFSR